MITHLIRLSVSDIPFIRPDYNHKSMITGFAIQPMRIYMWVIEMTYEPVHDPEIDDIVYTPYWVLESAYWELLDRIRNDGYLNFSDCEHYIDELDESFNFSGHANNPDKIRMIAKLRKEFSEYFQDGERVMIDACLHF